MAEQSSSGMPTKKIKAPSQVQFVLLFVSLCLAVLCQALDNSIIATAIPIITDEFNSLQDVGWYGSGYLLTTCAFQPSYGQLYNLFRIKWTFLVALALFELGSLVCGAAPNSIALIIGRAVAGVGSGGLFSGATLIVASFKPLNQRPIYNGILGGMYAIASIVGPLMGGAFTEHVTWRLCFYINLPLGVVTAAAVFFVVPADAHPGTDGRRDLPLKEKLSEFDFLGLVTLVPAIICFLLAIQWGGTTYAWANARIIVLFVVGAVLTASFVYIQIRRGDRAIIPPSVVKQRTIWACAIFAFFLFGSFLTLAYYLPLWFQAIKDDTATQSGIHNLPSILAVTVFSIGAGAAVFAVGYYTWICILASILAGIGAGFLSTFKVDTNAARWIGYQVLYGAGTGLGLNIPLIGAQTALPPNQIAEGTAFTIFVQTFGATVFIAVAQNVFNSQLVNNVKAAGIPVDASRLLATGATQLQTLFPAEYYATFKVAYNQAIAQTFYVTVATASLSILGAVFIPWLSVKKTKEITPDASTETNTLESQKAESEKESKHSQGHTDSE